LSFDGFTVYHAHRVGSGRVRLLGPVRSSQVESGPVQLSQRAIVLCCVVLCWAGSSGLVRLCWVQSGWVDKKDGNGKSGEGKGGSGKGQVICNNVT
jgi:hypothetical protein